ncbi:hypothetical protein Raf01_03720 [Rugosimonospora africana]|uniref:Uncharacterized protein n=1 Tax=Rugosimonospora africana TaxID=556532 RepID=A0A8J3QM37_9ACTN|nr:hypothetical protein Raf01_03720 [Rugosimonospora africana]
MPGNYPPGGRDAGPGPARGSGPGVYSSGGRASVPGARPSDPGTYSSGGRGERREPSGPGYPPAHVPPPPQYRPSWPSRGRPEAEPSWPSPGSQDPHEGGWSDRGRPAGEYGNPGYGRGPDDAGRRSGSARAGVATPSRAAGSASAGNRGNGRTGKDGDRLPSKLWMSILGGVTVVALVAVGTAGTLFMINDHGSGSASAHGSDKAKHDISNQQVDPKPLSTTEVFPAAAIAPDPAGPPYQVIKSEETGNCGIGAVGDLATLMTNQGCTQVVRATVFSPDKTYVITTGIFNLRDKAGAQAADDAIDASVGGKKGRFPGLAAGSGTDVIASSATQLGWDHEGHFLVYCVVARSDGKPIDSGDQATTKIINDMVEIDLKGTVIADRISPRPAPSGSNAPSQK